MPTEHRSKRFLATPSATPDDARIRYFDTVPVDGLRIVLRYLSRRPHHRNWQTYISSLSVNTAVKVGGTLARAASLEFNSIGGRHGITLETDADAVISRPLFYRLSLRRLVIKLPREGVLHDLLYGCGAELRELVVNAGWTVVTETDIFAISTRCTKLAYLAIRGNHVAGPLTPVWRSVGSTLTRFYIGWYSSALCHGILRTISVPDLMEHCVNLRRVDVLTLNDEVAEVLVALGSRIRVLGIEDEYVLHNATWREVYGVCTSLEAVHLKLRNSTKAIDVLSLVRSNLVSLTLHNPISTEDQFFSILSTCSILRKVEVHLWNAFPRALLCKLFESLKSVNYLTCLMGTSDVSRKKGLVDVVAYNLRNLESFTISTRKPLREGDLIALVGLPRLKFVTLRHRSCMKSVSNSSENRVVEVVKMFRDCAQLVQLEIDDASIKNRSAVIAEAAAMYGREDFDMFIAGVQYRTW